MPPRRTIRKPTRWSPEEWAQIEHAAADCGVPPLRYVREAALGSPPTRGSARGRSNAARRAHSAVNQLARVLNNLRQLRRVAEVDGDEGAARMLSAAASSVENEIARVPARLHADGADAFAALVAAGVALNALAHRANAAEELPHSDELRAVLAEVLVAVFAAAR